MILVNDFTFKSAHYEWLDFRFQPCSFPNPVDIWIDNKNLIKEFTETVYPGLTFEYENYYRKFTPLSAEIYKEYLLKDGKEVPLFSIVCDEGTKSSIFIDVTFEKNYVIWKNWKFINKKITTFPDIKIDLEIYMKGLKKLDKFVKRQIKTLTAYRPIDDALWLFIESKDFSISLESMNKYRRVETDSWPLNLDVDEFGEVVYCEWDLAMAKNYPSDVMEKEIEFLINECGFWIPGKYRLGQYVGTFWDINHVLIEALKKP